jgi:hypothetical protein
VGAVSGRLRVGRLSWGLLGSGRCIRLARRKAVPPSDRERAGRRGVDVSSRDACSFALSCACARANRRVRRRRRLATGAERRATRRQRGPTRPQREATGAERRATRRQRGRTRWQREATGADWTAPKVGRGRKMSCSNRVPSDSTLAMSRPGLEVRASVGAMPRPCRWTVPFAPCPRASTDAHPPATERSELTSRSGGL